MELSQEKTNNSFQKSGVLSFSAAHAIHDTYTAFLPALLPVLIRNLLLSKTQAGLLITFLQSPSIIQPFIGNLADKKNLRYVIILTPAITAIIMSLVGIAPNYLILVFALIIAGLSSSILHAVAPVITGVLAGNKLGMGMSFWMVGGEFGRTLGPLIIVTAIEKISLENTPWLMILGLFMSLLLYLRIRNISYTPKEVSKNAQPLKATLTHMKSTMLPILVIVIIYALMKASISVYLPTYLTEEGSNLWFAGAALSLLQAAGVIGAMASGSLSDLIGRRRVLFIVFFLSPIFLLGFLSTSDWIRIVILFLMGLTAFASTPVMMAIIQENYPDNKSLAIGIYHAGTFATRSVATIIVGFMGDTIGLHTGFLISTFLAFLCIPFIFLLPRSKERVEKNI